MADGTDDVDKGEGRGRTVTLDVAGDEVTYRVVGPTVRGDGRVLLDGDDDLLANAPPPVRTLGFVVLPYADPEAGAMLLAAARERLREVARDVGLPLGDDEPLEHWHRHASAHPDRHEAAIRAVQEGFTALAFPELAGAVVAAVSALTGVRLGTAMPDGAPSPVKYRIIRPGLGGANPLHRDVWLDHLRHALNVYIPLAGSGPSSSLCVVPGSHRWPESAMERTADGAEVDGMAYSVPTLVSADRPVRVVRPSPSDGQFLLFTPYALHGGVVNLEPSATRISLEWRLFRHRDG